MELKTLLAEVSDKSLIKMIGELVQFKATKDESYRHSHEAELEAFLSASIAECEKVAPTLPAKKSDTEALNSFFRKIVTSK